MRQSKAAFELRLVEVAAQEAKLSRRVLALQTLRSATRALKPSIDEEEAAAHRAAEEAKQAGEEAGEAERREAVARRKAGQDKMTPQEAAADRKVRRAAVRLTQLLFAFLTQLLFAFLTQLLFACLQLLFACLNYCLPYSTTTVCSQLTRPRRPLPTSSRTSWQSVQRL